MTTQLLKQMILDQIATDSLNININAMSDSLYPIFEQTLKEKTLLEDCCRQWVILTLYCVALEMVESYTEHRIVSKLPLNYFSIVKDKLTQAKELVFLLEISIEKRWSQTCRDQLLLNLDNLVCLMGARGFMLDYNIAKIWEAIYAECFKA